MKALLRISIGLTLAVIMTGPARGSKPSPAQLAQNDSSQAQAERPREQAAPWKDSLAAAFAVLPDSAERTEATRLVFLATYKHHGNALAKDAAAFAAAWKALSETCRKSGLEPLEMGEAIYRFTNSDWAPVGGTTGPGLDRLKTAKDYKTWGKAVIASGKKAKAAKAIPAETWNKQAASYRVRLPADLAKVGLDPAPVRF